MSSQTGFRSGLLLAVTLLVGCSGAEAPKANAAKAAKPKPSTPPPEIKVPEKITVKPDDFAGIPEAITALKKGAEGNDNATIDRAEMWLEMQTAGVLEPVMAVVRDETASVESRVIACRMLPKMGHPTIETLVWATQSTSPPMLRKKAIDCLGRLKPPSKVAIGRLEAMLDEEDPQYRLLVLQTLANIGEPAGSTAPKLLKMLETEKSPQVMNYVDKALKSVEPRRTLTPKK